MIRKAVFMESERCTYREVAAEDVERLYLLENRETVRNALFLALPQTKEQMLARIREQQATPSTLMFSIFLKDSGLFIGQTGLVRIDLISRSAVFYVAILDTDQWSRGLGTEISIRVRDYAFNTLNLNRIQLHVNTENAAAVKIYRKIGYEIEGTLRQAMYHEGRYTDFYVMGLLKGRVVPEKASAD